MTTTTITTTNTTATATINVATTAVTTTTAKYSRCLFYNHNQLLQVPLYYKYRLQQRTHYPRIYDSIPIASRQARTRCEGLELEAVPADLVYSIL